MGEVPSTDEVRWRSLRREEVEALREGGSACDDWNEVRVAEGFDAGRVQRCRFHGRVRIGRLDGECLDRDGLAVPVGLSDSRIVSCEIGDNVAIHGVTHLAGYVVGQRVLLLNVGEMIAGAQAEGEPFRVAVINEAGGREIVPFEGMTCGDAALWALHPGDAELCERLGEMARRQQGGRGRFAGVAADGCVVKHTRIVRDAKLGPGCVVEGADRLQNVAVDSSAEEPTRIEDGCVLVDGVVGRGCRITAGVKALRFVLGDGASLKFGVRVIDTVVGDNSTISCCEVLNDLIFPAHEQHHNNSFLIASLVMGQSNIAAGATIGSNHNSRAPDGEVHAGRGFWPGLCVSLKHNSKFASFTLLAKGDYPCELNVPLPFSLVNNNVAADRLELMPAWWWRHNMYALARNSWKFGSRDKRKRKVQKIEFDSLAPDTVEEIFHAMDLLTQWVAKAGADGEVLAVGVEKSRRKVVVLKAAEGIQAYRQMLVYYAMRNPLAYAKDRPQAKLADLKRELAGERQRQWTNLGGQLVARGDLDQLMMEIKAGRLDNWADIHGAYDKLWEKYPTDKRRHALATLLTVYGAAELTEELWNRALDEAVAAQQFVCDQTYTSRKKDFESPFRRMVYADDAEMEAVLGSADRNSFIKQVRRETEEFAALAAEVRKRG